VGVKGAATLLDRSFLLCPVLPRSGAGGGLLQTSDGSILGRDDDESKAASGGRGRNGKDEVGMVWVCSGVVFSACGRGLRGCQCLERRAA
jgi:hypothetical protein